MASKNIKGTTGKGTGTTGTGTSGGKGVTGGGTGSTVTTGGGTDGSQKPQGLTINGQYIKDLSFENPNPGNLFTQTGKVPAYDVNVEIQSQQVGEHSYEVGLKFNIQAKQEKTVLYILELTYAGVFTLPNLPENLLKQFLLIQCPHLLFPYARHVIGKTTGEGGFIPLQLNPMDFASLYKSNEGNIQVKGQASGTK